MGIMQWIYSEWLTPLYRHGEPGPFCPWPENWLGRNSTEFPAYPDFFSGIGRSSRYGQGGASRTSLMVVQKIKLVRRTLEKMGVVPVVPLWAGRYRHPRPGERTQRRSYYLQPMHRPRVWDPEGGGVSADLYLRRFLFRSMRLPGSHPNTVLILSRVSSDT